MTEEEANRDHVYAGAAVAVVGLAILAVFNDWSFRADGPVSRHFGQLLKLNFGGEIVPWLSIFPIAIAMASARRISKMLAVILIPGFVVAFVFFGGILIFGGVPVPNATGGLPVGPTIPIAAIGGAIMGIFYSIKVLRSPAKKR